MSAPKHHLTRAEKFQAHYDAACLMLALLEDCHAITVHGDIADRVIGLDDGVITVITSALQAHAEACELAITQIN